MAVTETQQILVEFLVDSSQIDSAITTLERTGAIDSKIANNFKQTTAEISKQAAAIKSVTSNTAPLKNSLESVAKSTKGLTDSFMLGFGEGVVDALKEAGVNAEEFSDALKKAGVTGTSGIKSLQINSEGLANSLEGIGVQGSQSLGSIRTELRAITEEMAAAKASGQDYGEEYEILAKRAGRLKDAIGDVNKEVGHLASDTSSIDGLISAAQGIAGGFAIAQGAAALFGDESEELQKTLLKVNAALAILQGLQSVGNVLTKESAALRFLDATATKAQAAAQALFSFVVGKSTGALKAFRIALASTGIGLLVIAIATLIANFDKIKTALSGVTDEQEDLAQATKKTADTEAEKLATLSDQDNILKTQGKTEREILNLKIKQTDAVIEARRQQILSQADILKTQIAAEKKNREILAGIINFLTLPLNAVITVINKVAQFLGKDLKLPSFGDVLAAQLFNEQEIKEEGEAADKEARKQLADLENDKAGFHLAIKELDKRAAADLLEQQNNAEQKAREERERALNDELAGLEIRRLKVQVDSQEEIDILKKIIAKKAELELNAENLTAKQREFILAKSLFDQIELQKKFNESSTRVVLEGLISRNNAELTNLNLTNEEKLRLTIENIITTAQIETDAAQGNADKIKEINKKRDADIKAAKLQSINETLDYELERTRVNNAALVREQQKIASDPNADINDRIKAIEELKFIEFDAIKARLIAVTLSNRLKLISDKEYNLKYKSLLDDQVKAVEDAQEKIRNAINKTNEDAIDHAKELARNIIRTASEVVNVLSALYSLQSERENQHLEEQRARITELRDAGAITEKEALTRMKRLEIEEKKIRLAQAKRDKEIALFQAIINTAAAIADSLPNLLLAGIAAALGAAQIALIASRPLPKFGKGKRKGESFEGWGEIGETGTELVQTSKGLYVAPKKTIVWLTKKDIVYNPVETQKILERSTHVVNKEVMKPIALKAGGTFDYDQMAKAISKSLSKLPGTNINIDENGFNVAIKKGIDTVNYLNKRYSSK